jgi:Protein of unknown function (DUF5131)
MERRNPARDGLYAGGKWIRTRGPSAKGKAIGSHSRPVSLLGEFDWLIVGGESGVGNRSRPMHPDWVRDLRDQVRAAGGALFLKQVGSNRALWPGVKRRKGENPIEWPPDLQIQDLPRRSGPSM